MQFVLQLVNFIAIWYNFIEERITSLKYKHPNLQEYGLNSYQMTL